MVETDMYTRQHHFANVQWALQTKAAVGSLIHSCFENFTHFVLTSDRKKLTRVQST